MAIEAVELRGHGAAAKLRDCCEKDGFFYLEDHGVDPELVRSVRRVAKRFFALPLAAKLELHFERTGRQRGYIPLGAEASDPKGGGDEKEALDFTVSGPLDASSLAASHGRVGENLWPRDLPELRSPLETYFEEMTRLGGALFELVAESVGATRGFFADKIDRPIAQLRLLHYPPRNHAIGIGAHCDYECFTILDAGEVAGLQIERRGRWVDVAPRPNAFVINLGEMLARWTNDSFVATRHRVVNRTGRERFSIPFFFGTNYDTIIECLPGCSSDERPPRYPPVPAGAYLADRLNEIYGSHPDKDDSESG